MRGPHGVRATWGSRSAAFFRLLHLAGTIRTCQKVLVAHNVAELTVLAAQATTPGARPRRRGAGAARLTAVWHCSGSAED